MNLMTGRAAFADGFMFKDKRTALFLVAIEAGFIDSF